MSKKLERKLKNLNLPLSPGSEDPYHQVFPKFVEAANNKKDARILELGSRNVSGNTRNDSFKNYKEYIGFDILEGPNVDKVGDVHKLSQYFEKGSIDFVFCISVFEHLMMPWKAVLEMNKVLKVGGEVYISTHPTWSPHELPWDFFRFLQNSAHSLFNKHTGFELIEAIEGLPCRVVSLTDDAPTLGLKHQKANLAIAIRARKVSDHSDKLKWDIYPDDINDTMYPPKDENADHNTPSRSILGKIKKVLKG